MQSPASAAPSFRRDPSGFTGAEKALLICFGLAVVALVGFLVSGGGRKAGSDAQRTLAAGDMFTFGDATPELIDYAGGGSAKEWTSTLDSALQLDFDNVVPGHGIVTTKAEMRKFRDSTLRLRTRVHDMVVQKKTRDEIAKVLQAEFHWTQLHLDRSLDGAIVEMQ